MISTVTLWGGYYYCPHFIDEETEAQRGQVAWGRQSQHPKSALGLCSILEHIPGSWGTAIRHLMLQSRRSLLSSVALQRMELYSPRAKCSSLPSKEGPEGTDEGILADIPDNTPQMTRFWKWSEEKSIWGSKLPRRS